MRGNVLFAGGVLTVLAAVSVSGCAAGTGTSRGSEAACAAGAYQAIRAHERLAGVPSACRGLGPGQLNAAASVAIRIASGHGSKSARRSHAGIAAGYVSVLITNGVPAAPAPGGSAAASGGGNGGALAATAGSRLGFSERVAQVGALLAWLAAAASGGWVLVGWLRAGGSLRRPRSRAAATAPPAVTIGHVCLGLLGLVLWGLFMISGQAALAWVCVGLLAPVAGLGMSVLVLGLPRPGATPAGTGPGGRQPVLVIAAHGLFATAALLMVALAAIGAG
jgi:hypothetical protein